MHSVLGRMRLETPLGSYKIRKGGKLLEFSIVDGDSNQSALDFLQQEKTRLKSIEKETEDEIAISRNTVQEIKSNNSPSLHTRSRSQKSLFDFEEDTTDPWHPILDGRDINRQ